MRPMISFKNRKEFCMGVDDDYLNYDACSVSLNWMGWGRSLRILNVGVKVIRVVF